MFHRRQILTLPLFVAGCGLLTFTVEEDASTTVDGAGILGQLLGALDFTGLDDFDLTIEQEMADQGVEEGDLDAVTLTVLDLHADPDLSFLASMEVWVEADDVDPVLVATGDSFPEGQADVSLAVTGEDLTDVVVAGGMRFRVEASGSAPVDDTEVDVHVEVEVSATAQGACSAAGDG